VNQLRNKRDLILECWLVAAEVGSGSVSDEPLDVASVWKRPASSRGEYALWVLTLERDRVILNR
jgi:hypothetical protein